jgi:hypothetical protein
MNPTNFDTVKTTYKLQFNKWHLCWLLFALNIVGFAAAKMYFQGQPEGSKAEIEAVDFDNKYGASVEGANTLAHWGLELLHILRGRN